jgi:hypothetical protein
MFVRYLQATNREPGMTTKPGPHKPTAHEKARGGGLAPTKGAHKQHRPLSDDEALDDALEQSFPASDPPAQTEPVTHVGGKKKQDKKSN